MAGDRYDVIIIGTGAGGGTLARKLAPTGKRILLLERGGFLPREKQNWESEAVVLEGRYNAGETWLDGEGNEFEPGQHYFVGGNTKFYGAAMYRFRERDFEELKHHGGVSPAWPIRYEDMEPYYTEAERIYQVHGERGADPTEPPASAPFPHPPVSHEVRIQEIHEGLTAAGYRPFHNPMAIMLDEARPWRSACARCGTCDGFPCLLNAKADAHVVGVLPALEHPNVTLLTGARATRLETDASGRTVTGVIVEHEGRTERYASDLVVLSCGAVNSAALLLRSASDRHPKGLANGSGVVGRHYMCHNNSVVAALSKRPNPTVFQKTIAMSDFYFEGPGFPFPMGLVQMMNKSDENVLKLGAPPFAPGFTLEIMAKRILDFWITSEDLPDPDNRVELDGAGRIVLRYRENNLEPHRRLAAALKDALAKVGCETHLLDRTIYLNKKIPVAGVAHQCGTVRFGTDPKTSALDVDCRTHEVDNLYVVDGSFFVSSSAVNPALTIAANALRVGEHLIGRLG